MSGDTSPRGPQVRIRVNHKYTAKDGWRTDETTVEIDAELLLIDDAYMVRNVSETGVVDTQLLANLIRDLEKMAGQEGEWEANRRNNADRNEALASVPEELPSLADVPF